MFAAFLMKLRTPANTAWEAYHNVLVAKVLLDGDRSSPPEVLMRKRECGRWIYRRPTPDEETDSVSQMAW
jgi:hypothetical protein